jgi:hypothetical protein
MTAGELAAVLARAALALSGFALFLVAFLVAPLAVLAVFAVGLAALDRAGRG